MSCVLYDSLSGFLPPELINIVRTYCEKNIPELERRLLPLPMGKKKEFAAYAFLRGGNRLIVATRRRIFEVTEDGCLEEWPVSFRNINYLTVIRRRSQDHMLVGEEILGVSRQWKSSHAGDRCFWLVGPRSGKQCLHLETHPSSMGVVVGFGDRLYSMNLRCLELFRVDKKNKCHITRRTPELGSIVDHYRSIAVDAYSDERRVYTHCSYPSHIVVWTQDLVPINKIDIACHQMTVIPLVPDYTGANTRYTSYLVTSGEEGVVCISDLRDDRRQSIAKYHITDQHSLVPHVGALVIRHQSGRILIGQF